MCEAAGWGHADTSQEFGQGSSDTLLAVDIPIIDYNDCKYNYGTDPVISNEDFKINEGNICAGSNGKEACVVYKGQIMCNSFGSISQLETRPLIG